jgi:hypothetical protein
LTFILKEACFPTVLWKQTSQVEKNKTIFWSVLQQPISFCNFVLDVDKFRTLRAKDGDRDDSYLRAEEKSKRKSGQLTLDCCGHPRILTCIQSQ